MVVLFSFCWRDGSDGAKKATVVEPIDPGEGGYGQILHAAPRALSMNPLGFGEAFDRLSEGIAVSIPDAANRWFNTSFS